MYYWDCTYCEQTFRGITEDDLKSMGKDHLENQHKEELESLMREKWTGKDCQNGCGYYYPMKPSEHPGFVCPECGNDHFRYYAGMHIWTGIYECE